MLDTTNIQAVLDVLKSTKETEVKNGKRYREILGVLGSIVENIDGHPSKAVEGIGELHKKLEELCDSQEKKETIQINTWRPSFWQIVLFLLAVSVFTLIGICGGFAIAAKLGLISILF